MNEIIRIGKNRKGLSKVAYIFIAIVVIAVAVYLFAGLNESCGNGTCHPEKGETCKSCSLDCGPCPASAVCGDGLCTSGENNTKCPTDCKPPGICGDDACGLNENCADCPGDCACGVGQYCSPNLKTCTQRPCGDGKCDKGIGEDCSTCSSDCGECERTPVCGDARCDPEETAIGCPFDCKDICGNGICGPEENCWDCPQDCKCADGEYCSSEEKRCLKPVCGNQKCEIYENSASCCIDCPCEISYTKCNQDTRACESPATGLGDEEIKKIVADYYGKKSIPTETITPKEVFVWGGKVGRKTEVKLAGQGALKYVLVTDAKEVIELPFF
jgi:hypothetical protein